MEDAYRVTSINIPYEDVVKRLINGSPTGGKKTKTYSLLSGEQVDIYHFI